MPTPTERSLLITLRVASGATADEPTVAAARYHIAGQPALVDCSHAAGIDQICDLVRAWLHEFADAR